MAGGQLGPPPPSQAAVAGALPPGLAFVSSTPSVGTYNPPTGIQGRGPGRRVRHAGGRRPGDRPGGRDQHLIVAGADFDPNLANNVASAVVTIRRGPRRWSTPWSPRRRDDLSPLVGETVSFVVAVANRGPDAAVGAAVADALPPGLAFVSSTTSVGTYNPATGIWWIGGMADGASATLVVVAQATAPVVAINTAIVANADFDPDLANNVASAVVTIRTATPPAVISLARYGFHTQPTSFVLGFNTPLVASAAEDVANYQIVEIGPGGSISAPILIAAAVYDAATDTVTLYPSRLVYLYADYVLTVNGTAPYGLISTSGIRGRRHDRRRARAKLRPRLRPRDPRRRPEPGRATQWGRAAAPAYSPSPAAVDAAGDRRIVVVTGRGVSTLPARARELGVPYSDPAPVNATDRLGGIKVAGPPTRESGS